MNVTVAEVLAGAQARAVPLSAECAGYLILAAADQVHAAPRLVEPKDVELCEDGHIRVAGGRASDPAGAERTLRDLLDALLLSASAPTAGLLRASRRPTGGGVDALVRELETALIPVNRAAAKRSLARLERETLRALESGRIQPDASLPHPQSVRSEAPSEPASMAPPPPSAKSLVTEAASAPVPPPVAFEATVRSPQAPAPVERWPMPVEEPVASEIQERTVVMARVAARTGADAELVETRPEPIVRRASARPPAAPPEPRAEPERTEALPPVAAFTRVAEPPPPEALATPRATGETITPVLGTRVRPEDAEVVAALEAPGTPELDEDDIVEVIVEAEAQTAVPEDVELLYSQGSDWTEPCPPLANESSPPPAALAPAVAPSATSAAEAHELTPPPRVPLPEPRKSDVDELLLRLGDAPIAVDELRSSLKRLAGMEPTPPPPGIDRDE